MAVRKLKQSWQYDFKLDGHPRQRKGGHRTKREAEAAEKKTRERLLTGARQILLADAYKQYSQSTVMQHSSRDYHDLMWQRIESHLGHQYIEEVDTVALDQLRNQLAQSPNLEAVTRNKHLRLVGTVLKFMWKRGRLTHVPYIPFEPEVKRGQPWYTQEERDRLFNGFFRHRPDWYLFFYITCRLGLRRGEVYAITHRQITDIPPRLVVDQAVKVGKGSRPAEIGARKNREAFELELTPDVIEAIRWHIDQGYAGEEFLFSKDGTFPKYLDSYRKALGLVQKKCGLRPLGHKNIGRHSVGSQGVTAGHSIKAVQAQLGHKSEASTHKYAHLGSKAQLRLVESLTPASAPHEIDGNLRSTGADSK